MECQLCLVLYLIHSYNRIILNKGKMDIQIRSGILFRPDWFFTQKAQSFFDFLEDFNPQRQGTWSYLRNVRSRVLWQLYRHIFFTSKFVFNLAVSSELGLGQEILLPLVSIHTCKCLFSMAQQIVQRQVAHGFSSIQVKKI